MHALPRCGGGPGAGPAAPGRGAPAAETVARDAAFCFIYPANLDSLSALGAELVFFSPLADEPVPACDAVWLPGGYPELHATTLAKGERCRASLADHVAAGRPVWAECGGMMPLFDTLATADGDEHPMWGLLPGRVVMQKRLAALGPQRWDTAQGELRGHTFHYSTTESPLVPRSSTASQRTGGRGEAIYAKGPVRASYFHAWFPSNPLAVARLALRQGAQAFALNSALGANPDSRVFYSRVKGELEQSLRALKNPGYPSLTFVRPGLIGGVMVGLVTGKAHASSDARELGPQDLVVVAVKAPSMAPIAAQIANQQEEITYD